MSTVLILLLLLPAIGAVLIGLMGRNRSDMVRKTSLLVALGGVALSIILAWGYLSHRAEHPLSPDAVVFRPEFVPGSTSDAPHRTTWNLLSLSDDAAVQFFVGVDGLGLWLIVLTTILMVPSVLISWSIENRANEFHAWLHLLAASMIGVFVAFDILLFYVFFELTLVPLFFLIGIWGGPDRRYAARKFFIFTLAGSVLMFLGLLSVVIVCATKWNPASLTFSIPELSHRMGSMLGSGADPEFWQTFQFWAFLAMMVGFAVKVPLFPVHTWLPLAHVEAPTAGSVLLAGVLLKMGTYGFLRLCLPLVPDGCITLGAPVIGVLSVIGIIYGALCAKAQDDIKKLVAYSSVSHLGFCTLGMFAFNQAGLTGSMLQMINHGLSTGGLFLVVGMLYERYHTRMMKDYSGIGSKLGLLSACMVFLCLSSVGLPGLNGFIGEAFVFFGAFAQQPVFAILASAGIILGAWYLMSMLRSVFFGALKEPSHDAHHPVTDLSGREWACLAPILGLCLFLGLYPQPLIDSMEPEIGVIVRRLESRQAVMIAGQNAADVPVAAANAMQP